MEWINPSVAALTRVILYLCAATMTAYAGLIVSHVMSVRVVMLTLVVLFLASAAGIMLREYALPRTLFEPTDFTITPSLFVFVIAEFAALVDYVRVYHPSRQ